MRVLVLMRGAPGCGKSTYIEKNNLTQYTLSADNIRAMYGYEFETNYDVSAKLEVKVWGLLMHLLEDRMRRGMFTVIDACNSKADDVQKYRRLAEKYRYRIYCVDFTDITSDICKARNKERPVWKQVPDNAIDKHYSRFVEPFPNYVTMIKRDELDKINNRPMDISEYKKVKVFGDIHGCYTVLNSVIGDELDDDTLYVFAGDYVDRGIETDKLLKWMISVKDRKNVIFIEGNHERYLRSYAEGSILDNITADMSISELFKNYKGIQLDDIRGAVYQERFKDYSKTFEKTTIPLIESANIKKSDLRQLCRKFWQCGWFVYHGQKILVTHGGICTIPANDELYKISTEQMILGTGKYSESDEIELQFEYNCPGVIQIHGHRNILDVPVKVSDYTYNLEGAIEMGGELRWVDITFEDDKVKVEPNSKENTVYDKKLLNGTTKNVEIKDVATLVEAFRGMPNCVKEKSEGNISSFNFTQRVFTNGVWGNLTVKARGLFINTNTNEIVARSYDKFFNYGERPETKLYSLAKTLVFPITAYVKENGFLGVVGYDKETDSLIVTSKSTASGEHAGFARALLDKTGVDKDKLKAYLAENNVSMVFEIIDIDNDPHIIEYDESHIVLLDIIKNDIKFSKLPYAELVEVAKDFGFKYKKIAKVYENIQELKELLENAEIDDNYLSGSGKYSDGYIEGYVFEDANGYMFKYKFPYYKVWKALRGVVPLTLRYGKLSRLSGLLTKTENDFYYWLVSLYNNNEDWRINSGADYERNTRYNIINMRRKWFEER